MPAATVETQHSTPGTQHLPRDGWIDLAEAAKRSGLSDRRLRQLAAGKWAAAGLARRQSPPEGGKPQWYVHETADAGLARVKLPDQIKADYSGVSQKKRDLALWRLGILKRLEQAVKAGFTLGFDKVRTTRHFLLELEAREGIRISLATLYNWERAYRGRGEQGLIDGRGGKATAPGKDDPFLAEVARLYLDQRKRKLQLCYEMAEEVAKGRGWTVRSYDQSKRFIRRISADVVYLHRFGERAYTDHAEPYIERDTSGLRANQEWNGDHHQFDVLVNWDGELVRPWITAWQDSRSRKIVGWFVFDGDPNQDTIFLALRHACHPDLNHCGVPEGLYVDNGKDYDAYALNGRTKADRWAKRRVKVEYDPNHVTGLCAALGVGMTHCLPWHGQSKPIERWFRTLEERFGKRWDTYCGSSPADKPGDLQLHIDRGHAPTKEQFLAALDEYVVNGYNAHAHTGDGLDGRTPDHVWAEGLAQHGKRVGTAAAMDLLMLKQTKPVKVGQNGVTYQGVRYGQYEAWRPQWLGKEVYLLVDPRDPSRVLVWSLDGKPIGWASSNVPMPHKADGQTLREAHRMKGRAKRVAKEFFATGPRMHEDIPTLMARVEAERAAAARKNEPPEPPPLKPVRTAIDEHLAAVRKLDEISQLRQAVGAENGPVGMDICDLTAGSTLGDDVDGGYEDSFMRFVGNQQE